MKDLLVMSRREIDRVSVLNEVVSGTLTQIGASQKIGISNRQLRRILHRFRMEGPGAVIHGLRGKVSNNKTSQELLDKAIALVREKYWDFGPTFASEKLEQIDKLIINHDVLRLEMIRVGIWIAKQRKHKHRSWRERKEYFGEMVQFDGSHHAWFELRGKICCLLASKDDATNEVYAHFTEHEDIQGVFTFWKEYIKKYGKPKCIYLDRGSVYKVNAKSVFDDPEVLTQFERIHKELGVEIIHAKSPQAKGRIENGFGTLQDRLVKEMRLLDINSIDEANIYLKEDFLPKYNEKFRVPAKKEGDFHTPLNQTEDLDQMFSIQSERMVNNDFTVRFKGQYFQLLAEQNKTVLQKSKVIIEERMDGEIKMMQNDVYLNFKEINKQDLEVLRKQRKEDKVYVLTNSVNKAHTPSPNHPWKREFKIKEHAKVGHFN